MKSYPVVTVGLGAAALAVGITASVVAAPPAGQGADRTIVVYEKAKKQTFKFVDAKPFTQLTKRGPKAVSPGDAFFITGPLFSDAAATTRTGLVRVQCTVLNATKKFNRVTTRCEGSAIFADGQIAFEGTVNPNSPSFVIAVIGGTAAYEGAQGQLTVTQQANQDSTDTIHLLGR